MKYLWIIFAYIALLLFNYYNSTIWFLAEIILALFLIFILNCLTLIRMICKQLALKKGLLKIAICSLMPLILFSIYYTSFLWEIIDWKLGYNQRMKIVELAKEGKLEKVEFSRYKIPYSQPILSNGGNEVIVVRHNKRTITVCFYITQDAPFSYWVYTNDNKIKMNMSAEVYRDLGDNWYRVKTLEPYDEFMYTRNDIEQRFNQMGH